jgi:hypothetical protein
MKKELLKIVLALAFMLPMVSTFAQCDVKTYTGACIQKMKPMGGKFLKSYKLEGKAQNAIEHSYTFSKGTTYVITLANDDPNNKGLKVTLLDEKKRVITSSYNPDTKKYYSSIEIRCQKAGIYYMSYSYDGKTDYCAASVLGFKR